MRSDLLPLQPHSRRRNNEEGERGWVECVGTVQEAGKNCVQILSRGNQTRTYRTVMQRYFSQPHAKVQSKPCAVLHVCIGNGGSQLPTLQSSDHTMIDSTH